MASRAVSEFRTQVIQILEDPVSGDLMASALTLVPCGHTLNEDTVNQIFQRSGLCPLDNIPIQKTVINYHVRWLVEVENNPQLKDKDPTLSQEAIDSFSRGKEFYNEGNYDASIPYFHKAVACCPSFEKGQVWLEAALARGQTSPSSSFLTASRRRSTPHTPSLIPPYAPPVRLDPQMQTSRAVTQATAGLRTLSEWRKPQLREETSTTTREQEEIIRSLRVQLKSAQITAVLTASTQAPATKLNSSDQLCAIQNVTQGIWKFSLCSLEIRDDYEVALAAIRRDFLDLRFASNRLRADPFIQQEALREDARQDPYNPEVKISPYFINTPPPPVKYTPPPTPVNHTPPPPAKAPPRKNSSCAVL